MKNILIFLIISISFTFLASISTRQCYGQLENFEDTWGRNLEQCFEEENINKCKEALRQVEAVIDELSDKIFRELTKGMAGHDYDRRLVEEMTKIVEGLEKGKDELKKQIETLESGPGVVITGVDTTEKKEDEFTTDKFEPGGPIYCHISWAISGIEGYPRNAVLFRAVAHIECLEEDSRYRYKTWQPEYSAEVGEKWGVALCTSAPTQPGRYVFKAKARLVDSGTGSQIGAETDWEKTYFTVVGALITFYVTNYSHEKYIEVWLDYKKITTQQPWTKNTYSTTPGVHKFAVSTHGKPDPDRDSYQDINFYDELVIDVDDSGRVSWPK